MNALVDKSRGLVLATHNPTLMKRLCSRGLVLESGRIVCDAPIDEALAFYNDRQAS